MKYCSLCSDDKVSKSLNFQTMGNCVMFSLKSHFEIGRALRTNFLPRPRDFAIFVTFGVPSSFWNSGLLALSWALILSANCLPSIRCFLEFDETGCTGCWERIFRSQVLLRYRKSRTNHSMTVISVSPALTPRVDLVSGRARLALSRRRLAGGAS